MVFNDDEETSIVEQLVNYLQPPPQATVSPPQADKPLPQAASEQDNSTLGDARPEGPHQNGDEKNMDTTSL